MVTSEKPPRIPTDWNARHNLLLGVLFVLSFIGFIYSYPGFSLQGENPRYFFGSFLIGLLVLGFGLLWHSKRLQAVYQIKMTLDGRQDDIFNGIFLVSGIVLCLSFPLLIAINRVPDFERPVQGVKLLKRIEPPKQAYIDLALESALTEKHLYIHKRTGALKRFNPQPGDTLFISIHTGRLGISHVSHLSWKPRDTEAVYRIIPASKPSSVL